MRVLDLGIGARSVLSGPARGRVLATYRKASYLRFGAGVVALTDATVERGPIHVRCGSLPTVSPGEQVIVRSNELVGRGWRLGLDAPSWFADVRRPAGVLELPSPELLMGDVPTVWPGYVDDLRAGDLQRAADVLGGRGPGLTPAGDDVLAGLLLVASGLGYPRLHEITVRTTEISAAYLSWAARGQGIEAAHDLLAGRDGALDRLLAIGASSGAALAYGIGLGSRYLSEPTEIQTARAGLAPGLAQRRACSVR